tara:strand:- start:116 stop:697 length:582 start_codon:yes stop_codon:yes gene_type:complete
MENTLDLLSMKMCSPMVVFVVFVIVSGVSLFMSRNVLKRYSNQRMENLYNLYSWNEIRLVIIMGVILYGLCQYNQVNLAWIFLIFPIIYIILKNVFVDAFVSLAHQNAPKAIEESAVAPQFFEKVAPSAGQMVEQQHQVHQQLQEIQQQHQQPNVAQVPVNKDIIGLSGLSPPLNSSSISSLDGFSGDNLSPF